MEERRKLVLTDPREIKALAHPARLEVLSRLQGRDRAMTATELAGYCDLSPSAMSYHLRAMERAGLVERAEGEDGRERPWRLAFEMLTVDSDSPAGYVSEGLVLEAVMREDMRHVTNFLATEPAGPWRSSPVLDRVTVAVTTEELATMLAEIREVTKKYAAVNRPEPPEGSRRVRFTYLSVPED